MRRSEPPAGVIRVRLFPLAAMLSALDLDTDTARADFLGLSDRTYSRLKSGDPLASSVVAKTLIALDRNRHALHVAGFEVNFEAVFEPTLAT